MIDGSLDQKEFALGVFHDVERAFDNTSFVKMDDAARDHGVCSCSDRAVFFSISGELECDVVVHRGCTIALTLEYGGR
jgi:hypothetical protein